MGQNQKSVFFMQEEQDMIKDMMKAQVLETSDQTLPILKPNDMQDFDKLLIELDQSALSPEEAKERRIMKLLLKVIHRILYTRHDLVRPYVRKILVVIEALLMDEDYYARV